MSALAESELSPERCSSLLSAAMRGIVACLHPQKVASRRPLKSAKAELSAAYGRGACRLGLIWSASRNTDVRSKAKLYGHRRYDPVFDRFVHEATIFNAARSSALRAARRQEANDYQTIRAMLPAGFPDRDDVVSRIFERHEDGSLKREDVRYSREFLNPSLGHQRRLFT